jgi:hypothetical protein
VRLTGEPVTVTPVALTVRLAFTGPRAVGRNTTLMVQDEPEASVVVQVPGLVVDRKNAVDEKLRLMLLRAVYAVTVSVFAVLVLLIAWFVNVSDVGATVACAPLPLSETGLFVIVAPVAVTVTDPLDEPTVVGWNATTMVQDAVPPAAGLSVVPQVPPDRANGGFAATVTLMLLRATLVCRVRV